MSRWSIVGKGVAAAFLCVASVGCVSQRDMTDMKAQYETQLDGMKQTVSALERQNSDLQKQHAYDEEKLKMAAGETDALHVAMATMEKNNQDLIDKLGRIGTSNSDVMEPLAEGGFALKGDTSFDAGLATLRPRAMQALDELAKELRTTPGLMVRIDGHTDNDPIVKTKYKWTTGSNFELAAARALAVLLYFEKQGIPGSQMFMTSYGEHHPRVPNDSKENKAKNRRVEIHMGMMQPSAVPEGGMPAPAAAEHKDKKDHKDHNDHK